MSPVPNGRERRGRKCTKWRKTPTITSAAGGPSASSRATSRSGLRRHGCCLRSSTPLYRPGRPACRSDEGRDGRSSWNRHARAVLASVRWAFRPMRERRRERGATPDVRRTAAAGAVKKCSSFFSRPNCTWLCTTAMGRGSERFATFSDGIFMEL